MAERHGIETFDLVDDIVDRLRDATDGRGPDSVVDAVGMEAHGNPGVEFIQKAVGILPDGVAKPLMTNAGVDRLAALHLALDLVQRGGTVSLSGVYAGAADPMPFMSMFDKQVTLRMGQCNVHRWRDDLLPLVEDPYRPARRRGSRDPPGATGTGARDVRHLHEEGGRVHQGRAPALIKAEFGRAL